MDVPRQTVFSRLRRSVWTLPLAALAALLLLGINELAYQRSRSTLDHLAERAQARLQVQRVWRLLLDAESSQRGYLLTGQDAYAQSFPATVTEARTVMGWLQDHYTADTQAAPLVGELVAQAAAKLSELETTLQQHASGVPGAWRELVLSGVGRENMDAFRIASQGLLALESRRVDAERLSVVNNVMLGRHGINLMAAICLLGLFVYVRQTVAFDREQQQHAQALLAERQRLEGEVARRTADLTELARHLQTAREDEKGRLARELHDELGALLTAAKLDSARLKRLMGVLTPEMETRLNHLNDSINRGIELKRRIIEDLSPSSLRSMGLVDALRILIHEFAERSDTPVHEDLAPVGLQDGAQITAFRLVQEALTNAAKYAGARNISVSLQPQMRDGCPGAQVSVADDGRGFDPAQRRGSAHGLMGMRYRVEAEGGLMQLQAAPGQGTRIQAWLPVRELPAADTEAAQPAAPATSAPAATPATPATPATAGTEPAETAAP